MEATVNKGSIQIPQVLLQTKSRVKGAIFTIRSIRTQKDFTFKVRKSTFNDKTYMHVYVESGYLDFKYLGFYWEGSILRKGGVEITTPAASAIAWVFRNLEKGKTDIVASQVEFFHTGKCAKCGKTLTDATSIELGVGPKCRTYIND